MHSKYSGDAGKQRPKGTKAAGVGGSRAHSRKSKETSVAAEVEETSQQGMRTGAKGSPKGRMIFMFFKGLVKKKNCNGMWHTKPKLLPTLPSYGESSQPPA